MIFWLKHWIFENGKEQLLLPSDIINYILSIYRYISYTHIGNDNILCRKCDNSLISDAQIYKCLKCDVCYFPCYQCDNSITFCRIFGYNHYVMINGKFQDVYKRIQYPDAIEIKFEITTKNLPITDERTLMFYDLQDKCCNRKESITLPQYYMGHLLKYEIESKYLKLYTFKVKCDICKTLQNFH